jgi:hypothetical protein
MQNQKKNIKQGWKRVLFEIRVDLLIVERRKFVWMEKVFRLSGTRRKLQRIIFASSKELSSFIIRAHWL